MGWLYMKSPKGHSGPRQYLDAQFTWERPDTISKVLRSALVGMRVYYAAVEHILPATGAREVWAAVCLIGKATSSATRICWRQWGHMNAIAPSRSSIC